jgi:predicted regulator of amino acid metabolism with ACT domain
LYNLFLGVNRRTITDKVEKMQSAKKLAKMYKNLLGSNFAKITGN